MTQLQNTNCAKRIRGCPQSSDLDGCPCRATVKAPVPGEGPLDAQVVIVGRNPDADEDKQSRLFVGRSGQLLNTFLNALNLDRSQCVIVNLVKCFTPNDREPFETELKNCRPLIQDEMRLLPNKKILFLLGDTVVQACFKKSPGRITDIEGNVYYDKKHGIYVIPLTHPSYWAKQKDQRKKIFKRIVPKLFDPLQRFFVTIS
jgi:uracil-DNA glycosylase